MYTYSCMRRNGGYAHDTCENQIGSFSSDVARRRVKLSSELQWSRLLFFHRSVGIHDNHVEREPEATQEVEGKNEYVEGRLREDRGRIDGSWVTRGHLDDRWGRWRPPDDDAVPHSVSGEEEGSHLRGVIVIGPLRAWR